MLRSLIIAIALLAGQPAGAGMSLLMFDQTACEWCARWDAEIGGAYHLTEEGREAPLERQSIRAPLPEGVTLDRPARFTPTFVLLRDGREVGRIEGYPGADFFYPMLRRLIGEATAAPQG